MPDIITNSNTWYGCERCSSASRTVYVHGEGALCFVCYMRLLRARRDSWVWTTTPSEQPTGEDPGGIGEGKL